MKIDLFANKSYIKLRDYQDNTVSKLAKNMRIGMRKQVMCAPTGAGKTVMFSWMASENIERGYTPIVVVNREQLVDQCVKTFQAFGLNPGTLKGGTDIQGGHDSYVCMVETMYLRMEQKHSYFSDHNVNLYILDEAHNRCYEKLLKMLDENSYVLGVTATPLFNTPGESMKNLYDGIVCESDITDLINRSFLCQDKTFGFGYDLSAIKSSGKEFNIQDQKDVFESNELLNGVVENHRRICPWTKTLVYNLDIEHNDAVANEFKSAGYTVGVLHSKMSKDEKDTVLTRFSQNKFQVLCNVGILTAGYDEPTVSCVVQNFCTKSATKYFQTAGRGSRKSNETVIWSGDTCSVERIEKKEFFILDMGANYTRFGLWSDPYDWVTVFNNGRQVRKKLTTKACPKCSNVFNGNKCTTTGCDYEVQVESKPKQVKEKRRKGPVRLELQNGRSVENPHRPRTLQYWCWVAAVKGYKPGWVHYRTGQKYSWPKIIKEIAAQKDRVNNEKISAQA